MLDGGIEWILLVTAVLKLVEALLPSVPKIIRGSAGLVKALLRSFKKKSVSFHKTEISKIWIKLFGVFPSSGNTVFKNIEMWRVALRSFATRLLKKISDVLARTVAKDFKKAFDGDVSQSLLFKKVRDVLSCIAMQDKAMPSKKLFENLSVRVSVA